MTLYDKDSWRATRFRENMIPIDRETDDLVDFHVEAVARAVVFNDIDRAFGRGLTRAYV